MRGRLRRWLLDRVLPRYCEAALLEEMKRLEERLARLEGELRVERAYRAGLLRGMGKKRQEGER